MNLLNSSSLASGNLKPAKLVQKWVQSLVRMSVETRGEDSIYPWVGRCGAANIADFPTLFKTEFRFLIPCLDI